MCCYVRMYLKISQDLNDSNNQALKIMGKSIKNNEQKNRSLELGSNISLLDRMCILYAIRNLKSCVMEIYASKWNVRT